MIKKLFLFLFLVLVFLSVNCYADTLDSYSESNHSGQQNMYNGTITRQGQAITLPAATITSVKFYLAKVGSPPGTMICNLYAATGTVGTDAIPTGSILRSTSTLVPNSVLATSPTYNLIEFTFTTPYVASAGDYAVMLRYEVGDGDNYIRKGSDVSSPTHAGNKCRWISGAWGSVASHDEIFYLYGTLTPTAASQVIIVPMM